MAQRKSSRDDGPGGNMYVLLGVLVLIVGIVAAAGMIMAVLSFSSGNDPPVNINMGGDSGWIGWIWRRKWRWR